MKQSYHTINIWEEAGFRQFVCSYSDFFIAFAQKYTIDRAAAEDIVQDCFYKLLSLTRKKQKKVPENPTAYMLTMIRNAAINRRRKESRMQLCGWFDPDTYRQVGFFEELAALEERTLLISAIDLLPPRAATIIRMSLDGQSPGQIACHLGMTTDSVKAIKKRAVKMLRARMAVACAPSPGFSF